MKNVHISGSGWKVARVVNSLAWTGPRVDPLGSRGGPTGAGRGFPGSKPVAPGVGAKVFLTRKWRPGGGDLQGEREVLKKAGRACLQEAFFNKSDGNIEAPLQNIL